MTFCRKVPKALFWIQCLFHSLEASGQGEAGRRGLEEGQRTASCSCHSNREVFSLNVAANRLDKQPSMHTSMRAHAQACPSSPPSQHLSLSPDNLKLPFQRDVPSVFSPNPIQPKEKQPLVQVDLPQGYI